MSTWIRGTIMLATLVGLPAAWIYWGPLPPEAQAVVDRTIDRIKQSAGWYGQGERLSWSGWPPKAFPAASAASETTEVRFDPQATSAGLSGEPLARDPVVPGSVAPSCASVAPAEAEDLSPLLAQLRSLGAVEYALERWGASGEMFRFRCAMPLGPSDSHTQHFEALSGDARESVAAVLREARDWQLARLEGHVRR
jgi:hypothetical protein